MNDREENQVILNRFINWLERGKHDPQAIERYRNRIHKLPEDAKFTNVYDMLTWLEQEQK
jgi:hypothetical protein